MKHISFVFFMSKIALIVIVINPLHLGCQQRNSLPIAHENTQKKEVDNLRKRPKNKPKPDVNNESDPEENNDKHHGYQPNPVVLTGVSHIMNGALNIAQDPHSRPNVGHSIASIIHGIATIIIEKLARKKFAFKDWDILEECYNEACCDIKNQISYMINKKR